MPPRHHFIKLGFLDCWKKVVPGNERATFARLRAKLDDRARAEGKLPLTIPRAYVEAVAQ